MGIVWWSGYLETNINVKKMDKIKTTHVGSLPRSKKLSEILFKKDKFSIPEAHVDKKFKKFFLHDVSNWKLKWRKINLNLKFLIFVIAD